MHVSLHLSPQSRSPLDDVEILDQLVDQVVAGDQAGVAAFCLTEHHLDGFNTYCDPFLFAAYLAPRVHQAHLAVHAVQMPLYHPVRVAEQCNLLDLLTRGRCMVALAPGGRASSSTFGIDSHERRDMARQRIEAMLRVWDWSEDGPPVDVSTDWDAGTVDARLSPASYRLPRPLLGRATLNPQTVVELGRRGFVAILGSLASSAGHADLYREALGSAGHDESTERDCLAWLGYVQNVTLAATEQEAERLRDAAANQVAVGGAWGERLRDHSEHSPAMTPAMLVERLLGFKGPSVNHARVALFAVPGSRESTIESFGLFLDEVLPHLDPEPLPEPARTIEVPLLLD
jgi:alkanesulfonate monooxygenase SsuD/methylene tetrahydromethanopterin reductase-like flavin-dependent oxidoreductase (luciferase family)